MCFEWVEIMIVQYGTVKHDLQHLYNFNLI